MAFRKVDNNNKSHRSNQEVNIFHSFHGEREVTAGILVKSGSDYFPYTTKQIKLCLLPDLVKFVIVVNFSKYHPQLIKQI